MKPSLKARLGVAVVGVMLALGVCELMARAIFPAPPNSARQPQIAYLFDPELRYVPAPNQTGWIDDGLAKINRLGFRGHEVDLPKPAGRFRIVTIGDSLTFGWGVNDDETFAGRVETLLRARRPDRELDVVNAGVGGYNTRQSVARLARSASELEPDLVVLGFYSNDVPDALDDVESGAPSGTRIVGDAQPGRVMYINPTPGMNSWWLAQLRKSRAVHVAGRAAKRALGRGEWAMSRFALEMDLLNGVTTPELDRGWAKIHHQFDALRTLAEHDGFSVAIVILPCKEQVFGQFASAQYQARVRALAEPMGFTVIDPLPDLASRARTDPDLFIPYDRNHPSAAGHEVIAGAIVNALASDSLTTE